MLIMGLLGMYFDAVVVFVTKSSLLFRLAVAILCSREDHQTGIFFKKLKLQSSPSPARPRNTVEYRGSPFSTVSISTESLV